LDLLEQRVRDEDLALPRLALPHGLDDELLRRGVAQQDDAVVGRDEVKGDREDAREQLVEVALEADVSTELVADAQALVVALELHRVGDLIRGSEIGLCFDASDDAFERRARRLHLDDLRRSAVRAVADLELEARGPDE